jgi:GntR family transcriptional regulator/MocR family aminotransferase
VGRLIDSQQPQEVGGLAVMLRLPDGAPDVSIAKEALAFGLAPTPLSLGMRHRFRRNPACCSGIATAPQKHVAASCGRLHAIIDRFT